MSRQNWLMLWLLSILWGGAYLVIELALQGFSPVVVVFGRVALAAMVLLPLALHRDSLRPLRKRPWWVLTTVLLQATAPLLLLTHGQQWLSAGLTGILVGAQPLFVALLALRFDPAERPKNAMGIVGLLLGFAGLALIFAVDIQGSAKLLLGGLLVTAAAICYASGSILIHTKLGFAPPLGVATMAMLVGSVVLFAPAMTKLPGSRPPLTSTLALIVLGVVFTGFTLRLFYGLVSSIGPGKTALAFYISPGVTVVLGWLLLSDPIGWSTLAGMAAVVVGSVMVAGRGRQPRSAGAGARR